VRIVHLLNHTKRLNGHVHAAVDLACAQVELGNEVAIASSGGDFDALLAKNGVKTVAIEHRRRPLDILRAVLSFRRFIRDWRADVVHAHMMTSAVLAWPACMLTGVPLITTVHNAFEKSAVLMGLGARVIAVSAAVSHSMQARGISKQRLSVVLNGTIGSARRRDKSRTPLDLPFPAIVFVGGQHPRKGLPDLLEAFNTLHREHNGARLYVVGGGPCQDEYATIANKMHCANAVTFVGPQDDPFPWMLGADIFVLPSHADPAPLVLSEAREAGCAIIATNVDGIPELLEHGRAGVLVPPRNPQKLSEALRTLVENPELLQQWKDGSQYNISHLTIERVARETLEIYAAARG
jgi:glycosyltransferase involved in cell wall biosynthesis